MRTLRSENSQVQSARAARDMWRIAVGRVNSFTYLPQTPAGVLNEAAIRYGALPMELRVHEACLLGGVATVQSGRPGRPVDCSGGRRDMRCPWFGAIEKRQQSSSYTDRLVEVITQEAQGVSDTITTSGTAALEAAVIFFAGVLSGASMIPAGSRAEVLTPSVRRMVGRQLIHHGESVWIIDLVDGRIRLQPVASVEITGPPDPMFWRYQCEVAGPDGTLIRTVRSAQVIHFRQNVDSLELWKGVAPLTTAYKTGQLAAAMEQRLGEEAGSSVVQLLAVPRGATPSSQ